MAGSGLPAGVSGPPGVQLQPRARRFVTPGLSALPKELALRFSLDPALGSLLSLSNLGARVCDVSGQAQSELAL